MAFFLYLNSSNFHLYSMLCTCSLIPSRQSFHVWFRETTESYFEKEKKERIVFSFIFTPQAEELNSVKKIEKKGKREKKEKETVKENKGEGSSKKEAEEEEGELEEGEEVCSPKPSSKDSEIIKELRDNLKWVKLCTSATFWWTDWQIDWWTDWWTDSLSVWLMNKWCGEWLIEPLMNLHLVWAGR